MVKKLDKAAQEERATGLAKEPTVAMTINVPRSIHTRMKLAAVKQNIGLYEMIIKKFDESY